MLASRIDTTDPSSSAATPMVLVRVGIHGQVGRFACVEPLRLQRGDRTVCRTARGIEIGVVLRCLEATARPPATPDGRVLRRTGPEDELLWGHLQQLGEDTFEQCEAWLRQAGSTAVLLEVEPLLDGRTLYFHFLSDVDARVQQYLDHLVELYEQQVRQSKFARLLESGCGPGCGTSAAKNGCGSRGGCAVCKVASACKTAN